MVPSRGSVLVPAEMFGSGNDLRLSGPTEEGLSPTGNRVTGTIHRSPDPGVGLGQRGNNLRDRKDLGEWRFLT